MKKSSKIVIMSVFLLGMLVMGRTSSKAALQANYTTHTKKQTYTGATLIKSIREMETNGQTMGLSETINASTLMPSSSNNGIDVHMMKSTEYGAVAILSASGFGNPKKLSEVSIKSSTGNVTGVYMGDRWEWTAGLCSASTAGTSVNTRYYDLYKNNDQTSAKVGDALGLDSYETPLNPGCSGWHGGNVLWLNYASGGFIRGSNGMFSFDYNDWSSINYCGRGVAVVQSGV